MRKLVISGALVVAASGCGWSVSAAREAYAQRWCNYRVQCGEIGSGHTYTSTDECLIAERANAQNLWPTADCEGKIDGAGLDMCLKAIENTQCNNLADQIVTVTKCTRSDVCN